MQQALSRISGMQKAAGSWMNDQIDAATTGRDIHTLLSFSHVVKVPEICVNFQQLDFIFFSVVLDLIFGIQMIYDRIELFTDQTMDFLKV